MNGMIPAIEQGFPQSEIAAASYRYQREVEDGETNRSGSEPVPIGRTADRTVADRRELRQAIRPVNWRRCASGETIRRCERHSTR